MSPLLFAIYLNDFKDYIGSRYSGLPFITDQVVDFLSENDMQMYFKLYCLLYADDTIDIAENCKELERALDTVNDYCRNWAIQVNTSKQK